MNPNTSLEPLDEDEQDDVLIRRAQAGDREAFGKLYARHVAKVQAFIANRVRDRATTEDITSDTWEAAWKSISRFAGNGRPFPPWVIGIARYQVLGAIGGVKQHHSLDEVGPDGERRFDPSSVDLLPEKEAVEREQLEQAIEALATLPRRRRTALILQVRDGMSESAIAKEMGTTTTAVHFLLHRARQQLRAQPARLVRRETGQTRRGGRQQAPAETESTHDQAQAATLSQLWTEIVKTMVEIEAVAQARAASEQREV